MGNFNEFRNNLNFKRLLLYPINLSRAFVGSRELHIINY